MPVALCELNQLDQPAFIAICGGFFEHSPWIAGYAWLNRPFQSVALLHAAMCQIVAASAIDQQLALIRAHPDLVGRLAREGRLTAASAAEQAAAGLVELTPLEADAFAQYNAQYQDRFGFPFVVCARENRKDAILAAFPRRLQNSRDSEISAALTEICKIARLRMIDAISED